MKNVLNIIVIFLYFYSQANFAMSGDAKLDENTAKILNIINSEDVKSTSSLKYIAKDRDFLESYDFLVFFMKHKSSLRKQYELLMKNLNKNDKLYVALSDKNNKIMLKLVRFLDISQAHTFGGPVTVNYDGSLHKNLFEIINSRGSYEDFEVQLYAIVRDVAKLLIRNAQIYGYVGGSLETENPVKKDDNCRIS